MSTDRPLRRGLAWMVISVCAAASGVGVGVESAQAAPPNADGWIGAGVLKGGKGYVTTPMGQVAYRDLGPRTTRVPMLLLHMTPLSMIQFAEAQNAIAAKGIRVIAIDTPGYGMSDPPPEAEPTIAAFADNLVAVLDQLKIQKVVIAGHHTGACIATSFAVRHPERVAAIILHGVPIFNEEEIAVRINRSLGDRTPQADGSHLSHYFRPPAPGAPPPSPEYLKAQTWFALSIFMEGPDVGHYAVYHYDMESDLKRIRAPGMILSDRGDAIHPVDQRAAKLRPDFVYKEFSDDSTLSIMMHPADWARVTTDYYHSVVR
jgi:pimeloyl-ACP methyl ester carboxylesterase